MNIYKDGGGGVTRLSLEFWKAHRGDIGKVHRVECSAEALLKEKGGPEVGGAEVEYTMIVRGRLGEIYLSGCTCGYGGEGPNGFAKVMADMGLPLETGRQLMVLRHVDLIFTWPVAPGNTVEGSGRVLGITSGVLGGS